MLEVSVVVFLLQGYLTSGREVSSSHMLHLHRAKSIYGEGLAPEAICCPGLSMHSSWVCRAKDTVSGLQALVRTLWMSGAYAAFENIVSLSFIFGARVPLFLFWSAPVVPLRYMLWRCCELA